MRGPQSILPSKKKRFFKVANLKENFVGGTFTPFPFFRRKSVWFGVGFK